MNKSELRAIILEELEKSKASLLTEKFASSIIGDINKRLDDSTAKDLWNSTANTYGIAWDKVKDEHVSTGANPRRNQLNIFFVAEGTRNPYADSRYGTHAFYRDALLGISVGKKVIGFGGNHFYRDPGATKKSKKVNTNADNYSKAGVGVDAKVWNYKRMLEVSTEVFSIDIDAIQNWNREVQTLRAEQQDGATAMQQNDEILKDNKNRYKQAIKVIKDAGVSGKEFEIVMEHLADAEQILTKELKQKIKDTRRGVVYPGWDNPFQLAVNLHSDMVKKFEDFQRYAVDAKKEGGSWYAKYLTQIAHDVKKIKVDFDRRIIKATSQKEQSITESVLPVNEGSRKKVTKSMWQKMSDDEKENALLTVFEDPDTAQKWIERKWNSLPGSVARDMYTESVGKPKVNERFKHNDMYAMLDIAAGYSSTQHQAANQMWSDEQDLYDYLKSDHIPKKYHKDFYNDVKRRFKGVNESVNEGKEQTVAKGKWEIVKVPKGSNNSTRFGDRYYLLLGGQHVGGSVTADGSFSPASSGNSSEDYVMKILKKAKIVESVNEAQLQDLPIKSLLGLGKFATVSMGEKKLGELSDAFEDIGDEQAARIADHLDMAIKLMKDGLGKSAVKHMNKFNKACGKELSRSK